jgi:hypothetical protein
VSAPGITYVPHPDATQEGELNALAAVYKFVLDCHAKKEATRPSTPDAAKEIKNVKNDSRHCHRNT